MLRTLLSRAPVSPPSVFRTLSTTSSVMAAGINGHTTSNGNGVHVTAEFGKEHTAKGVSRLVNAVIVQGDGSYVTLDDGRKMLDFTTGIGVTGLGHCHPVVSKAAADQCMNLVHGQCSIAFHQPGLQLIESLLPLMPDPSLDTFFFWNSGSEAVEASVKLARSATGRQNIISMQGGYHGRTFGAMGLTRSKTIYSEGVSPLMPGVYVTPFPYWHQLGLSASASEEEVVRQSLHQLNLLLAQQTHPAETAAILIEPVLGEGGYIAAPASYLRGLREICDKHGILLIFDEVQCGFGRTGKYFACEYSGVRPDIMIMAKGLANGFPLSGIVSRRELMDKQKPGTMGGTYAGNAVACAAAVAVTKVIRDEKVLDNVNARSAELFAGIKALRQNPKVGQHILDVRGAGLMVGVEFASPSASVYDASVQASTPKSMASRVAAKVLERGVLLLTTSVFEVVRFIPPLNISKDDMAKGIKAFQEAVEEVASPEGLWHVDFATTMRSAIGLLLAVFGVVQGYIPAQGTNDTQQLNLADVSSLRLRWPKGLYSDEISYQLARTNSSGYEMGAIVHFTEDGLTEGDFTPTPWVALISCDKNATNASMEVDIFTAARDRGAVAALLYSTESEACLINYEYTNPDDYDQIMDIFATKKKSSARLIESQFSAVNETYWSFNSKKLNESYLSVMEAVNGSANRSQSPPFLVSTLTAYNATSSSPNSNTTDNSPTGSPDSNDGKPNTGLAMIVLYAITGCVSVLFCVVILSGAIRAIRHPERYGPRSGDPNVNGPGGAPQTRAAGLARAVLDTFPVVKFGRPSPNTERYSNDGKYYDSKGVEMNRTSGGYEQDVEHGGAGATVRLVDPPTDGEAVAGGTRRPQPTSSNSTPTRADEITRAAIGVETCPICIVDFEDGDDLRVLPCEGRHRFHRDCVDQWLLDLSSSCPLCREDFAALEAMAAGNSPEEAPVEHPQGRGGHNPNRFSKYLRFAQRHRRDRSRGQDDPSVHNGSTDNVPVDHEHETGTSWRPRVRTGSHP